jgi:tetratricopeptide (TPR) repeat protein
LYAKGDHKEALEGLRKLEKDVNYVNKSFEIYFYMGYIYGDEKGNLTDYEKAKKCFTECLRIDSDAVSSGGEENIKTLTIYNDMGYMIMSEAEKVTDIKKQERLYMESINYFDKSIECLKRQKIEWANPYKNKGYCLGKFAALKSGQEQMKLFIQAFVMYQIAFALNDNFEIVKERFDKTIEDFLSKYNLCLKSRSSACKTRKKRKIDAESNESNQ